MLSATMEWNSKAFFRLRDLKGFKPFYALML
jgi:hypothetical protein